MDVILGIDTSCYTTSVALADINTENCIKYELKMLLPEKGEKGLRQSTALFLHIKNLPTVLERLMHSGEYNIKAVCVSEKPRPIDGSYMPVFEAGVSVAASIASTLGVPLYKTTHQENHIMAASNGDFSEPFLALHLSGGTTELVKAVPVQCGYNIDIVSATKDISFGKLIDRLGVNLGLDFPAGKYLDELAQKGSASFMPAVKLYDGDISLSGAEKQFGDIAEKIQREDLARSLFEYSARLLEKWVCDCVKRENIYDVLFAGGVSSNSIIKQYLANSVKLSDVRLHFAPADICRDNAVGTAKIGCRFYKESKK